MAQVALQELAARLGDLLAHFSQHSLHSEFLKSLPPGRPVRLVEVEVGGETYCLMRLPPTLTRLTERQRRIVRFISEGLSNKDIAGRLGVQPTTVASHLARIFQKLEVDSRASLAANWSQVFCGDPALQRTQVELGGPTPGS